MTSLTRLVLLCLIVATLVGCGSVPTGSYARRVGMDRDPRDLHVMTLNLRRPIFIDAHNGWAFRKDNLIASVRYVRPHIIATQECFLSQARELEAAFPNYQRVGVGRDDGHNGGEMCAIFFDARRFKLLDSGHFWLSENPTRPGSSFSGAMFPRMATWIKLRDKTVEQTFFVFNTHFSAFNANARALSAKLLRDKIKSIATTHPTLIAGDFNTGEDTFPHWLLTHDHKFADLYRVANPRKSKHEGTRHHFTGRTVGDRLDWILATNQWQTLDARILRASVTGKPISDHYPITATLRWATAPAFAQSAVRTPPTP